MYSFDFEKSTLDKKQSTYTKSPGTWIRKSYGRGKSAMYNLLLKKYEGRFKKSSHPVKSTTMRVEIEKKKEEEYIVH